MTVQQWVTVGIAIVTILVNVGLALWSARSARLSQATQAESQRLLAIEDRTADKKLETYMPFLKTLGDMLTPNRREQATEQMEDVLSDFQTAVIVWGSDQVVEAFARYRILASRNPPPLITMRLVADLQLAMRRDLAWPDTEVELGLIIGMRINDLDEHSEILHAMKMPLEELYKQEGWEPPLSV